MKYLKKTLSVLLAVVFLLSLSGGAVLAAGSNATAVPTSSTVLVDGDSVPFQAYNINGNNYFKLRDIAFALSGTEKQFNVGWDSDKNAISLTSRQSYTPVGGELESSGSAGNVMATASTAAVYLDGAKLSLTAYNINDNNYFKLRDLGTALNFGVGWDENSNTVTIDSGYSAEAKTDTPIEIGVYDPDYDYDANPTYTVQYVVLASQGLYEAFSDSFAHWASRMNINYLGMQEYGGDKDAYLSNLPTLAENCDGLLIDPDSEMYTRCSEILDEIGCPWMGCMAAPRDYESADMPLIHPFVGFDNYQIGTIFPPKLLEYKEKLWPDVPMDEFGFISVDFSVAYPLHQREMGCYDTLKQLAPDMAEYRYYVADTAINTFDADTSSLTVLTILTQHPEIEHWLVFAEVDDMAKGAAAAFDTLGLTDNACVMTFGGTGLQNQWDAGVQNAWRAACYLPQAIYTEPIIGALYAFMNGDATSKTLWPNWVNANDAGTAGSYASRLLPLYWIDYDNYQTVIKWSDIYAGTDFYPEYSAEGITRDTYSTHVEVPDYYAG